jgi:hypothetical protein
MKRTQLWKWQMATLLVGSAGTSLFGTLLTAEGGRPSPISKTKEWVTVNDAGQLTSSFKPLNQGDTLKTYPEGVYRIVNARGVIIEEGTAQGYDRHPCGCSPEKHGVIVSRYPNGSLKEITTFWCGERTGPGLSFRPDGTTQPQGLPAWSAKGWSLLP